MHIVKATAVIFLILCFLSSTVYAQSQQRLSWINLQDAETALRKEAKPILIDLYTNWCGWCKVMDKKTYSNKNVTSYLGERFYTVKLNAETKERILWAGKTFDFNYSNQTNDIALYLTQGRLSYPTTVIIPANGGEPQAIPGYLTPKEIEVLLKYFGENKFGKISFEEYNKSFKTSW